MPWPKTGATHYQAQLGLLRQRSCKRKEGAGVKKLRVHRMPRPKTGATHGQAQLGLLRQRPCKRKEGAGVKNCMDPFPTFNWVFSANSIVNINTAK